MKGTTNSEDLDAVINSVSQGKPIYLLGHSYGSILALKYAADFPTKVAQLIITGSDGHTFDAAALLSEGPKDFNSEIEKFAKQRIADPQSRKAVLDRIRSAEGFLLDNNVEFHYRPGLAPERLESFYLREAILAKMNDQDEPGLPMDIVNGLLSKDPATPDKIGSMLTPQNLQYLLINTTITCGEFLPGARANLTAEQYQRLNSACLKLRRSCESPPINIDQTLSQIKSPTLLVVGDQDPMVTSGGVQNFSRLVKNSGVVRIQSGHVLGDAQVRQLASVLGRRK